MGRYETGHRTRLQASVNNGDFQDVDVVGDDDQRPLIWYPRQLRVVYTAKKARQTFESRNYDTMGEGHLSFIKCPLETGR